MEKDFQDYHSQILSYALRLLETLALALGKVLFALLLTFILSMNKFEQCKYLAIMFQLTKGLPTTLKCHYGKHKHIIYQKH